MFVNPISPPVDSDGTILWELKAENSVKKLVFTCKNQLTWSVKKINIRESTVPIHPRLSSTRKRNHFILSPLTSIQCRTRYIIELAPPSKVFLPDQVLENEPHREPRRIIDPRRGWDARHATEDDGRANILDPRLRVTSQPEPERERQKRPNDHRVEMRVIYRPRPKLSAGTNETPNEQLA